MTSEEKARLGYQASISLITYEGQVIWRAFSSLLTINTGLITFFGLIQKIFTEYLYISAIFPFFGIILCSVWFLVLRRNFSYFYHWFAWAHHIEKTYLSPEVQVIQMGKLYGEGKIFDKQDNIPDIRPLGWTSRVFKVQWLMIIVIFIFLVLHIIMILPSFFRIGRYIVNLFQ